jgi:hypothetical protein
MKDILVLAGRVSEWQQWAADFIRQCPEAKIWQHALRLEANGCRYNGAVSTYRTEGNCCQEVIKIGTYWRVFSPEELRMLDFCAEIARRRAETDVPPAL